MNLQVDAQSSEPIFEQIAFQVKAAVARGELAAGARLPSVRELARDLSINPNTVVRAYDALEHEGVIVRRKGAGCFATGRSSELTRAARRAQLQDALQRVATDAFHLGFTADEVRAALESCLEPLQFSAKSTAVKPTGRGRA